MISLSSEELRRLNNLRDENIFEGDVLAVSTVSGGTGCITAAKFCLCVFSAHVLCKHETFMIAQLKHLVCFLKVHHSKNFQRIGQVDGVPIDYFFQGSVRVSNERWELEVQNRLLNSSLQLAA